MSDRIPFIQDHVQGFMFGAQIDVEPTPLKLVSLAAGGYVFDVVHRLTGSRNVALLAGFFDGILQANVAKLGTSLGRETSSERSRERVSKPEDKRDDIGCDCGKCWICAGGSL